LLLRFLPTHVLTSNYPGGACKVAPGGKLPQFVWGTGQIVENGYTNFDATGAPAGHIQCKVGQCLAIGALGSGSTWKVAPCSAVCAVYTTQFGSRAVGNTMWPVTAWALILLVLLCSCSRYIGTAWGHLHQISQTDTSTHTAYFPHPPPCFPHACSRARSCFPNATTSSYPWCPCGR
jgi:hypothetical protein